MHQYQFATDYNTKRATGTSVRIAFGNYRCNVMHIANWNI